MARTAKSDAHLLTLSANWQALFITGVLLAWLSTLTSTLLVLTRGYVGGGTWVFQLTTWVHPIVFFVAAFVLLAHYRPVMKRVFMACFATVTGMALYSAVAIWEQQAWYSYYTVAHPVAANDTSWWTAYGNDWTMMLASLVIFAGGLYLATRKSRR